MQTETDIEAGRIVVFAGPITDQDGSIKVMEGEVLTDEQMSSVDWFVKGMVGSSK
jgi:basic membrane protein A